MRVQRSVWIAHSSFFVSLTMAADISNTWKSKRAFREQLAARSIAEKLRMLDSMRKRAVSIRAAKIAQVATIPERPPDSGAKR
jgi:hypothetical protein